jgi:glycosyltransferase involved in cell wall biosynthesis
LKLLFITHKFYPDIGGIEVNSEILAGHFHQFGAQVTLLTWSKDEDKKTFPYNIVRNPSFKEVIKAHMWADIVFENNPTLKLSWPLIVTRKPNVVALRTWVSRMNGELAIQDKFKLNWLSRASKVIAVSEAIRKETYKDAVVIGNPYRSSLFQINSDIVKEKDFAFLGRLVSDKGVDMAIQMVANLSKKGYSTNLTIIGDGPEKESLIDLANKLGIKNNVTFAGVKRETELVDLLNAHRFLIAPSKWKEPFGNIALEGMACGCIPIVSDGAGLVDAAGSAGIVFERNNQKSLDHQVEQLLKNKGFELELRSKASMHLKKHEPKVVAQAYYDIIQSACND